MTTLAAPPSSHYGINNVEKMRDVLREIRDRAPGSLSQLAKEAGISQPALTYVAQGRFELEPERVQALVRVLRSWGATCEELADRLEDVAESSEEEHDG